MDAQQIDDQMPDRSRPGITTTALSTDKCATEAKNKLRLTNEDTIIGTWNVRTLYACGKLQELTHELQRYSWDILGLAEVRWTGFGMFGETTTDAGHKLWYSGDETEHKHGVGFIVKKERVNSVISCHNRLQ